MNLANKLTVLRVLMIPLFLVVLYVLEDPLNRYIGVAIFILASLTDLLDGQIARKYNLITDFGKFMDPLADKLLVAAAMIYMVEASMLSAWVVIIIISREFIVSGIRLVAATNGTVIAAGWWGKIKTSVTMIMIIVVLLGLPIPFMGLVEELLIIAATVFTLISGGEYLIKNIKVFDGAL